MKVLYNGSDTCLTGVTDFNLRETLECGQCFNFVRTDDSTDSSFCAYRIIAGGRVLFISEKRCDDNKQNEIKTETCDLTLYDTDIEDYESFWKHYFDLDTDYLLIKKKIVEGCPELESIIRENPGIRLLNQEFFETLISFIISQNKQIPQIKAVVRNLSELAGKRIDCKKAAEKSIYETINDDYHVYLFPTVDEMRRLTEDDIRYCKAGFRAPYIMDAVNRVASGEISASCFDTLTTDEARVKLMTIKGVGEKVANCVLLFSLGRREAFPVDVWMKRIMEELYFHKDTDKKLIERFACEKFGKYAGYAQQYLFIYGRNALK